MNLQAQMRAMLEKTGIPAREIKVYGSQIMITCIARDTTQKWSGVLHRLCRKVRVGEGIDDHVDAARFPNERGMHTMQVWRVWGTI